MIEVNRSPIRQTKCFHSIVNQRNASYSYYVSVKVNVNKRRMNINKTEMCGLPEGVNAVFNGRKFDHANQSNRRILWIALEYIFET